MTITYPNMNSTGDWSVTNYQPPRKTLAAFPVELKAEETPSGSGIFAAKVSAFGNTDLNGDRVLKGAFSRTIREWTERGQPVPVIESHGHDDLGKIIGEASPRDMKETNDAFVVAGRLFLKDGEPNHARARQVFDLMKRGLITAWSYAFTVPPGGETIAKDGVREISDLDLIEVGPTLIGANPKARTIALKQLLDVKSPPWHVEERGGQFCVILDEDGTVVKCHDTRADAVAHVRALYANASSGSAQTKAGRRHSTATRQVLLRMQQELADLLADESDEPAEASAPLSEADRLKLALAEFEQFVTERGRG